MSFRTGALLHRSRAGALLHRSRAGALLHGRAGALLALMGAAATLSSACATTTSPTYTAAQVTLAPCPRRALTPGYRVTIPFSVVNRSHRRWQATYTLLTLQEAAAGFQRILGAPQQPIGGNIRRVTQSLEPGGSVHGEVIVRLDERAVGQVNIGAWGAPANSVAVPSSYVNPKCVLHPR